MKYAEAYISLLRVLLSSFLPPHLSFFAQLPYLLGNADPLLTEPEFRDHLSSLKHVLWLGLTLAGGSDVQRAPQ